MSEDLFQKRLRDSQERLSPTARRVGQFIDQNRVMAVASSAAELAQTVGTSDATIIRTVQALGYAGLSELRQALLETMNINSTPAANMRNTLAEVGDSADHAVASVIETNLENIRVLAKPKVQTQIVSAVRTLHACTRILIFAIGPSRGVAEYMQRVLIRHGRDARLIGATGNELADLLIGLQSTDGIVMMAYGRTYREIQIVLAEARAHSCPTVLVTDKMPKEVAQHASVVVPAKRGREDRVALHGATFVILEAIALGLAATNRLHSIQSLERLAVLRSHLHSDVAML